MRTDNRIVVNLPKSHRLVDKFKSKFPDAIYYGATSLGSGRPSYLISIDDYQNNLEWLKQNKITKSKSIFN
jgi:hypothetical protein